MLFSVYIPSGNNTIFRELKTVIIDLFLSLLARVVSPWI